MASLPVVDLRLLGQGLKVKEAAERFGAFYGESGESMQLGGCCTSLPSL